MAEADVLNLATSAAALMCDFTRARTLFERELALRTALDDRRGMANALRGISFALMLSNNNLSDAQQYGDQALAICRTADDRWGIAWSLYDLGYLALVRSQLSTAQALLAEVLPIFYEQGISFGAFRTLLALGHLMRAKSNAVQARQFYGDALHLQRQMHYVLHIADGLEGLAALLAAEQKPAPAVRLFGAAYAHRRSNALTRPYHQNADYERNVALARSQLDGATWDTAWSDGCAMTLEQAVEYALAACDPKSIYVPLPL
jgi:tetratricopeptide (TPR) repeat protein